MNTCRLSDTWRTRDNDVGHVAFSRDDLEALYRFRVSDYIVEEDGSVLFNPGACKFVSYALLESRRKPQGARRLARNLPGKFVGCASVCGTSKRGL